MLIYKVLTKQRKQEKPTPTAAFFYHFPNLYDWHRHRRKCCSLFAVLNDKQKEFISFVLSNYIKTGVDELEQEKLPILLINKFQSLEDAKETLGDVANISLLFAEFQKHLYQQRAA